MSIINTTFQEDMEHIVSASFIDWNALQSKTFFVTGATGLIGYNLIAGLMYANKKYGLNVKVKALVRDENKAKERFADFKDEIGTTLEFVLGSVEKPINIEGTIDYIVHGASVTSSKGFVEQPVETIRTALDGTINMLELAKEKNVTSMVYLSSMEVYGYPTKGKKVTEDQIGTFVPQDIRNSYPLSKVQCEALCYSYAKEYGVPAKIIRLTQTFGAGVNYTDNRIFAYFGRCVDQKENIVLKTLGETERSYLYATDAVTAILVILQKGANGESYNAADEQTYCSIADMAQQVAASAGIEVEFDVQPAAANGFPNPL